VRRRDFIVGLGGAANYSQIKSKIKGVTLAIKKEKLP
jgi:hypothetical protein